MTKCCSLVLISMYSMFSNTSLIIFECIMSNLLPSYPITLYSIPLAISPNSPSLNCQSQETGEMIVLQNISEGIRLITFVTYRITDRQIF